MLINSEETIFGKELLKESLYGGRLCIDGKECLTIREGYIIAARDFLESDRGKVLSEVHYLDGQFYFPGDTKLSTKIEYDLITPDGKTMKVSLEIYEFTVAVSKSRVKLKSSVIRFMKHPERTDKQPC